MNEYEQNSELLGPISVINENTHRLVTVSLVAFSGGSNGHGTAGVAVMSPL